MVFSDDILKNRHLLFRYRDFSTGNYPGFYHYHRGIELLFVHRGQGHIVLNRKLHPLEAGHLVFIQPFQLHRLHFEVSDQSPYERTILNFEPTSILPFLRSFPIALRFFEHMWKDELINQVFRMGTDMTYISTLLERFDDMKQEQDGADYQEATAMMIIHLFHYLQSQKEVVEFQGVPRTERHAEKIMQWVEEQYTNPFELDELAKELHLSKHHVSHLFRTETGSSITEYVIARRIRQACWLLKTESTPVELIGSQVGIPHFSYFCRLFKKVTGVTPKQFRNSYRSSI
ncbi:AraC family transcriptional regulator [Paenibacillus agricola]|uniref:AraC family transcriptional regulator n=1 Tax=Paenibacillus agricola TaxID=2716264 RepID=A0ABX0J1N4_9BACL|nr:AraC family transcriptional regulator [Paenibacillus agricola]NHN29029.1 AraC family transcriptional regulator [Paenibacillus agricola]